MVLVSTCRYLPKREEDMLTKGVPKNGSSVIGFSPQTETTQMSVTGRMENQTVVHAYCGSVRKRNIRPKKYIRADSIS